MSVSGAKSIESSAAPRTDFDRTRITPSTMLDGLLDRPGDGDLDVLDRQAGRLGDDHDPREGDLGIDAAGHAGASRRSPKAVRELVVRTISPKYGRARATRLIPPPARRERFSVFGSKVRLMGGPPPPLAPPSSLPAP